MNEVDLRLQCLSLAQGFIEHAEPYADADAVVRRARVYADFVLGTADAEVIDAARELARKIA